MNAARNKPIIQCSFVSIGKVRDPAIYDLGVSMYECNDLIQRTSLTSIRLDSSLNLSGVRPPNDPNFGCD